MFKDKPVAPMIPVADMERAKAWYAEMMDLKPDDEGPGGAQYKTGGGTQFWLYPSQFAGTNKATAMGFLADDLQAEMDDLRKKGVKFEEYDIPGVKTVDGIAQFGENERGCWFKDSEGNIISLAESPNYKNL